MRRDRGRGRIGVGGAKAKERPAGSGGPRPRNHRERGGADHFPEITEWLVYRPMVPGKRGPTPGAPRLAASRKGGGEIVLHEFPAAWDDDAVARKAGEVVAKAAAQPPRVKP